MSIKYSYRFLSEQIKGNSGYSRLRCRVRWNKNLASFSVKYVVEDAKWSPDAQRCKANSTHTQLKVPASVINAEIQLYCDTLRTLFDNYNKDAHTPTMAELKADFNAAVGRTAPAVVEHSVHAAFNQYISEYGFENTWSESSVRRTNTIQNHFNKFNSELMCENITEQVLSEFIQYLYCKGVRNNVVIRYLRYVKQFLKWCYKKGYTELRVYETYNPRIKPNANYTEMYYLTWQELMTMYNLEFAPNERHLEEVRDVFCFCCFTGLRFSEVKALTKSNIKKDCIEVLSQKTSKHYTIELNKYSRPILEKYADTVGEFALPVLPISKYNFKLKTVGRRVGLTDEYTRLYHVNNRRILNTAKRYEIISSHWGRHTFIVNALNLGITAEVIMKWTGHSDYKSMKPYIKIVDELKKREMSKFDEL
jgi:integrase